MGSVTRINIFSAFDRRFRMNGYRAKRVWFKSYTEGRLFRDNRRHEVDMLERDNGQITGIAAKASASVKIQNFRGLTHHIGVQKNFAGCGGAKGQGNKH